MRSTICACALVLFLGTGASGELVHRYSFNDGTANDSVGGANGIAVNGPTFSGGQIVFDPQVNDGANTSPATGQYVDLPNGIARHRALSIEVWTTYRGGSVWQRIVDFGNSTKGELLPSDKTTIGYEGHGFLILTHNVFGNMLGQISIDSWGDPADTDYSAASVGLSTNVEHSIAFTHDPDAGSQALYLDGVKIAQTVARVDPSTSTWNNYFLGRSNFYRDPFYNGSLNEVRLYDNALSAEDIVRNYRLGPNAVVPEPMSLVLLLAGALTLLARRFFWASRKRP